MTRLIILCASLLFGGCHIPSGYYRVTARVTTVRSGDKNCHMREDVDGWTRIICLKPETPSEVQK
jgi:hypothetical protein